MSTLLPAAVHDGRGGSATEGHYVLVPELVPVSTCSAPMGWAAAGDPSSSATNRSARARDSLAAPTVERYTAALHWTC